MFGIYAEPGIKDCGKIERKGASRWINRNIKTKICTLIIIVTQNIYINYIYIQIWIHTNDFKTKQQ